MRVHLGPTRWACQHRPVSLLGVIALTSLLLLGVRPARWTVAQSATVVHYHAGWNLVAAPTGTIFDQATGPAYALDPGADAYRVVQPGEIVAGRAVWLYFAQDTSVTLGRTAAAYSRVLVPPGTYTLAGNPTSDTAAAVTGADAAYTYDPQTGYTAVQDLQPGRGAFILAASSGVVVLGQAPNGVEDDQVAQLQAAIAAHPDDVGNLDRLVTVAGEQLRSRQYGRVQTTLDDMRATEEDGLHRLKSAPLPPLTAVQREALVHVREDVAQAQTAATAGDTAMADTAIASARTAAQTAVVDASSLPPSVGLTSALPVAAATTQQADPAALAQFGAYVRAVLPKTGLATPLAPPERQLATDLLTTIAFTGTWSDGSAVSFTVSRDGRYLSNFRVLTQKRQGVCTDYLDAFDQTRYAITNRAFTFTYTGDAPYMDFVVHYVDVFSGMVTSPQEVRGTVQVTQQYIPNRGGCTGTLTFTATSATPVSAFSAAP